MNSIILKLALSILLKPLTSFAKKSLEEAIKEWYRKCLRTESTTDDAIAGAVAKILSIDISDVDSIEVEIIRQTPVEDTTKSPLFNKGP